jgi:hypothetical protein
MHAKKVYRAKDATCAGVIWDANIVLKLKYPYVDIA